MSNEIEVSVILFLFAVLCLFGVFAARRVKSRDRFIQGTGFSCTTSMLSRGLFIMVLSSGAFTGDMAIGFQSGMQFGLLSNLGLFFMYLSMAFLVAPRLAKLGPMISPGDVMQRYYGEVARTTSGVCAVFMGLSYVVVGLNASALFCEHYLKLDYTFALIFIATGITLYTATGGFGSILKTRTTYMVVIVFALFSMLAVAIQACGGMEAFVKAVPKNYITLRPERGNYYEWVSFFLIYFLPSMDPGSLQYLLVAQQREKAKAVFAQTAGLGLFIWLIPTLIGLVLYVRYPEASAESFFELFCSQDIPAALRIFAFTGILIISASTVDVFLHTTSIALNRDILGPMLKKNESFQLFTMRLTTVLLGAFCVLMLLYVKGFHQLMSTSFSVFCPLIGTPMMLAILGIRGHRFSFYAGLIGAIATHFIWKSIFEGSQNLDVFLPAVAANLLLFFVTEAFIKPFQDPGIFKNPEDL